MLLGHLGKDANKFELFCIWLEEQNHLFLANELRAELKYETDELQVPERIAEEAGVLVHVQFGASRTVPEVEKKKMIKLLAARTQYAIEVYKFELDRALKLLASQETQTQQSEELIRKVLADVTVFMKINRHYIESGHDAEAKRLISDIFCGADGTSVEPPAGQVTDFLAKRSEKLLAYMSRILVDYDRLRSEKANCLKLLNITNKNVKLDDSLGELFGKKDKIMQTQATRIIELEQLLKESLVKGNSTNTEAEEEIKILKARERHLENQVGL